MPVIGITGGIATGKSSFTRCLSRKLGASIFDADAEARELLERDPTVRKEVIAAFGLGIIGTDGRIDRAKLRERILIGRSSGTLNVPPSSSPCSRGEAGNDSSRTCVREQAKEPTGDASLLIRGRKQGLRQEDPTGGRGRDTAAVSPEAGNREDTPKSDLPAGKELPGPMIKEEGGVGSLVVENPRALLEGILHPRIRQRWLQLAEAFRGGGAGTVEDHRRWLLVDIPLLYETGAQFAFDAVVVVACSAATQQRRLRDERGLRSEEAEGFLKAQDQLLSKVNRASHVIWSEFSLTYLEEQAELLGDYLQVHYG